MAGRRKKVPLGNQMVEAEEVAINSSHENWNEYLLSDGSVVRVKLVVTEAVKVVDMYDQQGNPVYVVQSTNIMSVSAPDEIRRDPGEAQ